MRIAGVVITSRFIKSYKKLPQAIKEQAKQREVFFRADAFDARLDTHKLHGVDKEAWAFSITRKYRIKFIFLTNDSVLFLDVGTHDIYS